MTTYRVVSDPRADLDVEGAFDWYEKEQAGLGEQFVSALRATYDRITDAPFAYQDLRSGIRRALVRRFPYAVYFTVECYSGPCRPARESRPGRMAETQELNRSKSCSNPRSR
jgi:plasmid stabilization system protein ParE